VDGLVPCRQPPSKFYIFFYTSCLSFSVVRFQFLFFLLPQLLPGDPLSSLFWLPGWCYTFLSGGRRGMGAKRQHPLLNYPRLGHSQSPFFSTPCLYSLFGPFLWSLGHGGQPMLKLPALVIPLRRAFLSVSFTLFFHRFPIQNSPFHSRVGDSREVEGGSPVIEGGWCPVCNGGARIKYQSHSFFFLLSAPFNQEFGFPSCTIFGLGPKRELLPVSGLPSAGKRAPGSPCLLFWFW